MMHGGPVIVREGLHVAGAGVPIVRVAGKTPGFGQPKIGVISFYLVLGPSWTRAERDQQQRCHATRRGVGVCRPLPKPATDLPPATREQPHPSLV